jgi:hypothetical protein
LENQNNKEKLKKNCYLCATKVCFSFPFLANFHSSSFYEREKTKRSKAQKTKVMIHGGRRMGWGDKPFVVVPTIHIRT